MCLLVQHRLRPVQWVEDGSLKKKKRRPNAKQLTISLLLRDGFTSLAREELM